MTLDNRSRGSHDAKAAGVTNRLSQQLSDLSQMGKDLSLLKKMSKRTKLQMENLKNIASINRRRPGTRPTGEDELFSGGSRFPTSKMMWYNQKVLNKNVARYNGEAYADDSDKSSIFDDRDPDNSSS